MAKLRTDIGFYDYQYQDLYQPKEIGHFSLGSEIQFNKSQVKYFIPPSDYNDVEYDLTKGYEEMTEWKGRKIDDLLQWIRNDGDSCINGPVEHDQTDPNIQSGGSLKMRERTTAPIPQDLG
ncbi:hypothetical protein MAR_014930 [Mya arenaria]|uniref:RAI1-like domain-containing protein n=1 Tax=Mya arenaria TaxID=6604 RepID=A0ABY7FJ52_MYAAR|nr:hypothetical protein MAR_014930 [Mya arenaria]